MPTSVHWHGVRLENGMDGVSGLTQAPIAPGDSFAYRFPLQDAGTFWYHAHHRSYMQVAQGLYGALIVDEPERPDIDADEALLIDDWRLDPETVQIRADFDNRHDHSHAGRLGNLVTVNGAFTHEGARSQNSRLRLRLINAANARVFRLGVQGMSAWVMALDGMPVAQPWPLNQPIDLAPGQRVDLFADITAAPGTQAHLVDIAQNGEGWALASWTAQTGGTRLPRPAPQPLPENPQMAVPAIDTARQVQLDMTGGAMGGCARHAIRARCWMRAAWRCRANSGHSMAAPVTWTAPCLVPFRAKPCGCACITTPHLPMPCTCTACIFAKFYPMAAPAPCATRC